MRDGGTTLAIPVPRRRRSMLAALGLAPALALAVGHACVYPPTEVIVVLDSDVPLTRSLTITARVSGAAGGSGTNVSWIRGGASGIRLPATFGVLPARGAAPDEEVTLRIDAHIGDGGPDAPAQTIHRTARFSFQAQQPTLLRIFLSLSCAALTTGCVSSPPAACTVSARCEEMGQTCGNEGRCTDPRVTPQPTDGDVLVPPIDVPADRRIDAATDAPTDVRLDAIDVVDSVDTTDTPADTVVPDVPLDVVNDVACPMGCPNPPNAVGICVASACQFRCNAGFSDCDMLPSNGCEANLASSPTNCGVCGRVCTPARCEAGQCPPINDSCTRPTTLGPGIAFPGTTCAADMSSPACSVAGGDVFYAMNIPAAGMYRVDVTPVGGFVVFAVDTMTCALTSTCGNPLNVNALGAATLVFGIRATGPTCGTFMVGWN